MQPLPELYALYVNFPDMWALLVEWENRAYNNFRPDYSLKRLEQRFAADRYIEVNQVGMVLYT